MRRKRAKLRIRRIHGPTIPHLNSMEASTLPPSVRKIIHNLRNRLSSRRNREKNNLLFPTYRVSTNEDMKDADIQSWFELHALPLHYILHLANWEIYSSKLGSIYLHGRQVRDPSGVFGPKDIPKQNNPSDHWFEVTGSTEQSLDKQHDFLHVVRPNSPLLQEVLQELPTRTPLLPNGLPDFNYSVIVNGLMTKGVGTGDSRRSPDSFRISFGFNEFGTPTSFGLVDRLGKKNAQAFKSEVGRIAELLCACMQSMQAASGNSPIFTDNARDRLYAAKLRFRLHLSMSSPMRAEMVAVCCMKISPNHSRNLLHRDKKNPEDPPYNRSGGTFSTVVGDDAGNFYLLQILVATSRRYAVTLGKKGV